MEGCKLVSLFSFILYLQVVYPALDAKVKNVTSAYSVEHEDEERLFEQLSALLSAALQQDGRELAATLRQLECKIEEVHLTLRKHLAKEEEQLFPLLLKHFTFAEQVYTTLAAGKAAYTASRSCCLQPHCGCHQLQLRKYCFAAFCGALV